MYLPGNILPGTAQVNVWKKIVKMVNKHIGFPKKAFLGWWVWRHSELVMLCLCPLTALLQLPDEVSTTAEDDLGVWSAATCGKPGGSSRLLAWPVQAAVAMRMYTHTQIHEKHVLV